MQQAELIEIGILNREAVENFKMYGTTQPTEKDIKIFECRQYNLKLKAKQEAKRSYWQRVNETRAFNLALRQKEKEAELKAKNPIGYRFMKEGREIVLLEMVKLNPMVLSSVR